MGVPAARVSEGGTGNRTVLSKNPRKQFCSAVVGTGILWSRADNCPCETNACEGSNSIGGE